MTKMSDKYFQWSLDISFFVGYTDYLPDVHRKLFVAYTNDYQQKTGLSKASYVWSLGGGGIGLLNCSTIIEVIKLEIEILNLLMVRNIPKSA